MGEKSLKAGVVACAFIAQKAHIPSILKCRNVKLTALCDRNEDLARNIERKYRIREDEK